MRHLRRLLVLWLLIPTLAWGQTQLINGNRVQAGWVNYATTGGTATAYTLTFTPPMPGYVTGQCFVFKPHATNTGAATLNVQGLGAKALTKRRGSSLEPLGAGDLLLGHLMQGCYDGTDVQLMGAAIDVNEINPCRHTRANLGNAGQCRTVGATALTVIAADASRCAAIIVNNSANPMVCRDASDGVPTATAGWRLPPGQWLAMEFESQQQWQCIRTTAADAEACVLEAIP